MIQLDTLNPMWGEFAEVDVLRQDDPADAALLVSALVELSFGTRVTELAALAAGVKGPLLYVGSKHEAIPRSFEAAGLPVTILDPHGTRECGSLKLTELETTGPFGLVVLPMLSFGAWAGRSDPDLLIARIVACLAADGAIIVDQAMPFTPGVAVEVVDACFPLDGGMAAGRIGCRTEALTAGDEPASYVINGLWTDEVAGSGLTALLINREVESKFERTLVAAGLILVDSGSAGASLPACRLATYKRRVASPLCHPFTPLSLSSMPSKMLILTEGQGSRVRDSAGKEYIDACSGLWNTQIGLGNSEVIDAISAQLHRLSYATLFAGRGNEPARELAELLVSIAPYPLQWVCYTGSGSESTDLGIRIAVLYAGLCGRKDAKLIAHLDESYHGTFGSSASVSGLMPGKELFESNSIGVSIPTPNPAKCPPGEAYIDFALRCADVLEEKAKAGDIAAFIFEPVPASAGVIVPPVEYFERIQSICTQHSILLMADEVATGFGRTGRWFACEHFGLRPDIMLMAKGINSGYLPLGAVMFSAAIGEKFLQHNLPLLHGSTYNGHPVCCASALANIAVLKREHLVERSEKMGRYLREALQGLQGLDVVADVRGLGMMQGVVLKQVNGKPADALQILGISQKIQESGVLIYPLPGGVIGLCPALTISREDIDLVVEIVRGVLSAVHLDGGVIQWIESATPVANVDLTSLLSTV